MSGQNQFLAVIPARGGSKGLPGKNIRPFLGLPLIAHSILFAKMCPQIDKLVVSTDSEEIAGVARDFGADVPFIRPLELAEDSTPMWPVIRHALEAVENEEGPGYEFVLLLDPTSPAREIQDVDEALGMLKGEPRADGIVSVSQPDFNPIWHCVVRQDGFMRDLMKEAADFDRRQDVPNVYRMNGALYIWRTPFVRREADSWRQGRHLMYEMADLRSMSIDDQQQFQIAELLVRNRMIEFPWLDKVG